MSSPSKRVMPNWTVKSTVANVPSTSDSSENPYSIKRRSFDPLTPENAAKSSRATVNNTNGLVKNNNIIDSSDSVSSMTENNNDVSSSGTVKLQENDTISSSNITETEADSTASQPDSTSNQQTGVTSSNQPRVMCQYGTNCYRKNNTHREIYSHPGDSDYMLRRPVNARQIVKQNFKIIPNDNAPECRFGAYCYRRNPLHFQNNKHPTINITDRPQRNRNPIHSSVNYDLSSESDGGDFSADEDEEYVPSESE